MTRQNLTVPAILIDPVGGRPAADASDQWVVFIDGPRGGQRREWDDAPDSLPVDGGTYVRSVHCADDGDLRYVFHPDPA